MNRIPGREVYDMSRGWDIISKNVMTRIPKIEQVHGSCYIACSYPCKALNASHTQHTQVGCIHRGCQPFLHQAHATEAPKIPTMMASSLTTVIIYELGFHAV